MSAEQQLDPAAYGVRDDDHIAPRLERMRSLRSAWGVLAPSGLVENADEIGATGRALTDHLSAIVKSHSDVSDTGLAGIDNLLAEFETSIRHVATNVPVSALRSALPGLRGEDRRGLSDLLDLLIGDSYGSQDDIAERIGAIDYLITLLCTHGAERGAVRFDPVTLTERLSALCAQNDTPDDLRLADVEGEFFAAANLDTEELREEHRQRTLRGRKVEIGALYFAPRVLRAIVTYNAALLARVADELLESADWGTIDDVPSAAAEAASVFDSKSLRTLATAVHRRLREEAQQPTPIDRIAWALDFDYLAPNERKALESDGLATPDDPLGTVVLIGLLCRSVAVLSIDLQDAGLPPDQLTGPWVDELNTLFQEEINRYISDDAYKVACALSELKNKFLLEPLADHLRGERAAERAAKLPPPRPSASPREESAAEQPKRENARELVREALTADDEKTDAGFDFMAVPWASIGQGIVLAATLLAGVWYFARQDVDLNRMNASQLAQLSPYLEAGKRDGEGAGRSFVGEIADTWLTLPSDEREMMAEELVDRLRAQGMQQVMIYDADRRVRIQALGSQPIRVL